MSTADIIVTPARIFYAPLGEALPADTLAYGGDWAGNWEEIAITLAPFTMNREVSTFEVMIEQSTLPVKRSITEEKAAFETTLAEFTGANLQLGTEGTNTVTPAGVGQPAKETLEFGGQVNLTERTWGAEGLYVNAAGVQFPIRLQIYRATAVLNGALQFGKANAAGIPLRIESLGDLTKVVGKQVMKVVKITAPAS